MYGRNSGSSSSNIFTKNNSTPYTNNNNSGNSGSSYGNNNYNNSNNNSNPYSRTNNSYGSGSYGNYGNSSNGPRIGSNRLRHNPNELSRNLQDIVYQWKSSGSQTMIPSNITCRYQTIHLSMTQLRIQDYYLIRKSKLQTRHQRLVRDAISSGSYNPDLNNDHITCNLKEMAFFNDKEPDIESLKTYKKSLGGNSMASQNTSYNSYSSYSNENRYGNYGNNNGNNNSNSSYGNNGNNGSNGNSSGNIFSSSSNNSNNRNIFNNSSSSNNGNGYSSYSSYNNYSANNNSNNNNSSGNSNIFNRTSSYGNNGNGSSSSGNNIFSNNSSNNNNNYNSSSNNPFSRNNGNNTNSSYSSHNIFSNNNNNGSSNNNNNNSSYNTRSSSNNIFNSTANNNNNNSTSNNSNNIFNRNSGSSSGNNIFSNNNSNNSNNPFARNNNNTGSGNNIINNGNGNNNNGGANNIFSNSNNNRSNNIFSNSSSSNGNNIFNNGGNSNQQSNNIFNRNSNNNNGNNLFGNNNGNGNGSFMNGSDSLAYLMYTQASMINSMYSILTKNSQTGIANTANSDNALLGRSSILPSNTVGGYSQQKQSQTQKKLKEYQKQLQLMSYRYRDDDRYYNDEPKMVIQIIQKQDKQSKSQQLPPHMKKKNQQPLSYTSNSRSINSNNNHNNNNHNNKSQSYVIGSSIFKNREQTHPNQNQPYQIYYQLRSYYKEEPTQVKIEKGQIKVEDISSSSDYLFVIKNKLVNQIPGLKQDFELNLSQPQHMDGKFYKINGKLVQRKINLPEDYSYQPTQFRGFNLQELQISNQHGTITWAQAVNVKGVDFSQGGITIGKQSFACTIEQLNKPCLLKLKRIPENLIKYRADPDKAMKKINKFFQKINNQRGGQFQAISINFNPPTSWLVRIESFPKGQLQEDQEQM